MAPSLRLGSIRFWAVAVALVSAALWLWTNFCGFPWSPWNDVRLAPVFMAAKGVAVYPRPGAGVLTTWLYGPAPLWLWWPATLAHDVVTAVVTAGALNIGYTVAAFAIACAWWPVEKASRAARWLAFAGAVALCPYTSFEFLQADNVAVALGLIANTALVCSRAREQPWRDWLVAGVTALALASKQTSFGIVAAQIAWLWLEFGRRRALLHLVRTGAAGAALALVAIGQFGFESLWFGMVQIPGRLPWTDQPGRRLWDLLPILIVQIGVPLLILLFRGRRVLARGHPLRLPFLAWIAGLPLGLAGTMTAGGALNSFQGFGLLMPPLLLWFFSFEAERRNGFGAIAAALVAIFAARWTREANRPLLPATTPLHQAEQICQLYPHQIWFPWNPTVTYFAEGRFYHAEDGLYVRRLTRLPPTWQQFRSGLPPEIKYVALFGSSWQIALAFTRGPTFEQHLGYWELWRWKDR